MSRPLKPSDLRLKIFMSLIEQSQHEISFPSLGKCSVAKTRIAKLNLTPGTQLKKKQGLAQPRSRVKNYRQLDSLFFDGFWKQG